MKTETLIELIEKEFRELYRDQMCTRWVECPQCHSKKLYVIYYYISGVREMLCPHGCFDYKQTLAERNAKVIKNSVNNCCISSEEMAAALSKPSIEPTRKKLIKRIQKAEPEIPVRRKILIKKKGEVTKTLVRK